MATRTSGRQCGLTSDVRSAVIMQGQIRPAGETPRDPNINEVGFVKAKMARFTVALSLLATIALTLGAGVKWT